MTNKMFDLIKQKMKKKKPKKKSEGFLKDTVNPFLEVGMLFTLITTFFVPTVYSTLRIDGRNHHDGR